MGEIGWYLVLALVLIGALIAVLAGGDILRAIERHWPNQSLFKNIRGGVYVREPRGSAHVIQNIIEQRLNERGMRIYTLQRPSVEDLVNDGIWANAIASGNQIDVAIIGTFVTRECQIRRLKRKDYPSTFDEYETVPGSSYTLDVRFYGPGAEILGGYADTYITHDDYRGAMNYLASGMTRNLKMTFSPKIGQTKKLVES